MRPIFVGCGENLIASTIPIVNKLVDSAQVLNFSVHHIFDDGNQNSAVQKHRTLER